jgi:hypothetical protein
MENYMMYSGTEGVYTHTVKYERDPSDPMCGAGVAVPVHADMTLQQVCAPILSTALDLPLLFHFCLLQPPCHVSAVLLPGAHA